MLVTTMKIGFLLCSSPESQDGFSVGRLADGLLAAGHSVSLFLMDDGVYHATRHATGHAARQTTGAQAGSGYSSMELSRLLERGAKVALCAVTARARGLGEAELDPRVELSSQYELAQMVREADRFLAFGTA
jgi:sulfur relay (sulfurtransferase) complex TusBCD TusD component (DsrE family)